MTAFILAAALVAHRQTPPVSKPIAQVQNPVEVEADRKPKIHTGGTVLIRNGRVETVSHGTIDGADILIDGGKIVGIGPHLTAPPGAAVIDATGKIVTPGLVDSHCHRGEDESNEYSDAITSEVRIRDVLNPSMEGLWYNLAHGITTCLVLHGSANPIGGQSIVIKSKWNRPVEELPFPGAPEMIKFALGENVTGKNDPESNRYPSTRLGVETVYRRAFADARDYMRKWEEYTSRPANSRIAPPRRDLRLEALAGVLKGRIWVNCHSYRQDEMLMMARLSQEYGFHLVLHHALEGYKIAPELAQAHIPVTMFGDAFTYKVEVLDSIPQGPAMCDRAGVLTAINTDSTSGITSLSQDAGKQVRYGVTPERALAMITLNPAVEIGVAERVGSLDLGKDGDIAIWQGDPLSVYSKCAMTLIDGEVVFQRRDAFGVDAKSAASPGLTEKKYSPDDWIQPKPAHSYLITGATIHPVAFPDIPNGSVLVEEGKITKIGKNLIVPAGTVTIDAHGLDVYPGFIDAESQIGLNEIESVKDTIDNNENGDFHPDLKALTGLFVDSSHIVKSRMNGLTAAAIAPVSGMVAGQASVIRLAGDTTEEMGVADRCFLVVNMPERVTGEEAAYLPATEKTKRDAQVAERIHQIRDYLEAGKRYIAAKDAGEVVATDVKFESMRPYLEGKSPVLFRAEQESSIRQALAIAKALGLNPVIGGGQESWRVKTLLAERHVPVILDTPSTSCPDSTQPDDDLDPYDSPFAVASILHDAGVQFCFESYSADGAKNLPYGVGRMCAFGLPHDVAIRALTLDAAQILGVGAQMGSIEPGKAANLVITDGDPLEVTTNVKCLLIDGKPIRLESHFTDLYRRYSARVPAAVK